MERKALERAEASALQRRAFTMTPHPGGAAWKVSGLFTNEGAATVWAVIEPLSHPTRRADTGESVPHR